MNMNHSKPCKTMTELSDAQRIDRLYQAVERFEGSSELAKRVYHMGTPCFTDSCSTASLAITKNGQRQFNFNRRFFDSLDQDAMIFVVLHETLHYTFCHLARRQDRISAWWNIACDLVTNTFLLEKVGFGNITNPRFHKFLESSITFDNLPIASANDRLKLTAEEVYDLIAKNAITLRKNTLSLVACDNHTWLNEGDEGEMQGNDAVAELVEETQRIFREWLPNWGDTPVGELRAIGEITASVSFGWDKILSLHIASAIKIAYEDRWAPPNRKIAWLYPAVLLPCNQEVERFHLSVLMAIDASGSIEPSVLEKLIAVARSIPTDRVQLTTVSFDTNVYPVDIKTRLPQISGGGGTSFDAVERFCKKLTLYPDLIVVLTDGFAPRPTVQHPMRWFWLITEEGTPIYIDGIGKYCLINGGEKC